MPASDDFVVQFREAFRLDELTVAEEAGWAVSIRPGQVTIGSMVISALDGHLDFQDLSPGEAAGLASAFATAERLAKEVFGAVRINLACLMMKDPIVHFHVIPRYMEPVERYGRTWVDADWPGPPTFGGASVDDDDVLRAIRDELSAAL